MYTVLIQLRTTAPAAEVVVTTLARNSSILVLGVILDSSAIVGQRDFEEHAAGSKPETSLTSCFGH